MVRRFFQGGEEGYGWEGWEGGEEAAEEGGSGGRISGCGRPPGGGFFLFFLAWWHVLKRKERGICKNHGIHAKPLSI